MRVTRAERATGTLVGFIRSQRVNAADKPDTTWTTAITSQAVSRAQVVGLAFFAAVVRAAGGRRRSGLLSARAEFRELVARWEFAVGQAYGAPIKL